MKATEIIKRWVDKFKGKRTIDPIIEKSQMIVNEMCGLKVIPPKGIKETEEVKAWFKKVNEEINKMCAINPAFMFEGIPLAPRGEDQVDPLEAL